MTDTRDEFCKGAEILAQLKARDGTDWDGKPRKSEAQLRGFLRLQKGVFLSGRTDRKKRSIHSGHQGVEVPLVQEYIPMSDHSAAN
jgi:hypothetical protein